MAADGTFDIDRGQFGIQMEHGATVEINGGTVKAGWYAVLGQGNDTDASNLIVNGGELISVTDYCIYIPSNITAIFNDGIVDGGAGAICLNKGSAIINGGEFASRGTGNTGSWSDGTGNVPNAIFACNAKYAPISLTINGGEFDVHGDANTISVPSTGYAKTISLLAGTYNFDASAFVKEGYVCRDNHDGTWTVVRA